MTKHSERRSSLRRPIHHEAVMKTEDGLELSCIIADFCLDGMFIKFMSEAANRTVDMPSIEQHHSRIELSFIGEKGKRYAIEAEIVHHLNGACGLHFMQRYDAAVQSLVNLSINTGLATEHSLPVQTILQECIEYINGTFEPLLKTCWGALETELRTVAVTASNDQKANALMALAEKIKQRHNKLHETVMHAIEDPVAAFNIHLEKRKAMSDRLSIIDKDEFEDWLVSRVLVMRCEADYQSLLLPLKLRLDALGVGDKRHHQSVFGPALLVNSFQPVIQALIVDSTTEKLIFRVFESHVMLKLKDLYEGLNRILVKHNILPKLDVKQSMLAKNVAPKKTAKAQPSSGVKRAETEISPNAASLSNPQQSKSAAEASQNQAFSPSSETPLNSDIELSSKAFTLPPFSNASMAGSTNSFSENQNAAQSALSNITGLLRSLRKESETPSEQQPEATYSTSEFDEGLSAMQVSGDATSLEDIPRSLIERVQENLSHAGEEKNIDDNKKAAIDVVDRFFLSMRNNPRISSEAKQYLLKLEVPVLKVLLKDERFFEDHQSSVRAVMNRIAQLGAKGAKLNPASREKVSQLVHKIIQEFENDTGVFDEVLSELNILLDRQSNLYVKNVERVAAAAEGSYKVEEANVAVTREINARLAHKFVPSAVVTLIKEGWKDYLNLSYIKHGETSEQWQEGLSVIDRLIAFGEDPRIPIDIKVILPRIQEGLKQVSGNNEASLNVREALKAFILNAPKGQHLSEQANLLKVPETEDDLLSRNINKSQELKDWIVKVKNIPLGAWMQFQKNKNETTYMRLVWVAKGYSKFVFVNHQGMKVIELGLFKLATYFKDGRISVDSDYELPIVNQGLDDMVKDVYDKLAYESSHDVKTGLVNKSEFCRQVSTFMKNGKRTSACSLLFLHFKTDSGEQLVLPDLFESNVVSFLESLSPGEAIVGRVSNVDFVFFCVVEDELSLRLKCQEFFIGLCQKPDYAGLGLMVSVGESRAHLGFNNPESMINHACEAINYALAPAKAGVTKTEQVGEIDEAKPETAAPAEQSDTTDSDVVVIDETVAEEGVTVENDWRLDLWGQKVAAFYHEKLDKESAQVKTEIQENVQLNLLCVVQGESHTYAPETKEAAIALDKWWIDQLVKIQSSHAHIFDDVQQVRVQLSAYALNDDNTLKTLSELAAAKQLMPEKIYFDIYDCYQLEHVELAAIRMNKLKTLGFHFCLDHFGSDRSPFSYLKALPIDMIKIDDTFISALNKDDEAGELAADSIIEIAHYMQKKVLATGVDSAVGLQKMKHLKVDYAQGSTISAVQKMDF